MAGKATKTAEERFWAKVRKSEEGCWLWTASTRSKGYGAFCYKRDGKDVQGRAHIFSYELHVGPVPEGECVLHKCDTPACVRPDHLFTGTKADNNRDMCRKGRHVPGGTYSGQHYRRGSQHWGAKLTEQDVKEIRAKYAAGACQPDLADEYGVKPPSISRIVNRVTWRHV